MSVRYPTAFARRRPPTPRLVRACRRQARHHAGLLTVVAADARFTAALGCTEGPGGDDAPGTPPAVSVARLAGVVRSAAVQMGAAQLAVEGIQRVAARVCVPLCPLVYYALVVSVDQRRQVGGAPGRAFLAAGLTATMVAVFALVGVRRRARAHIALFAPPALAAGAILAAVHGHPSPAVEIAVVVLLGLPATYMAFVPALVLAFGLALRTRLVVDPRARIVLRLLRLLDQVATRRDRILTRSGRRELMLHIEGVSRIAEHDLPRLLSAGATDPGTALWLATSCRLVAASLREGKRLLLLPGATPREDLMLVLSTQFVWVCCDDWQRFGGGRGAPPPASRGSLRRALPYLVASALLAAAALAAPWLLREIAADDVGEFQTILLLSALASLVPLPSKPLLQVADVLRDVAG